MKLLSNVKFSYIALFDPLTGGIIKEIPRVKKLSGPQLVRSWTEIPHVTQHDEIDITEMEQFRTSLFDHFLPLPSNHRTSRYIIIN